MNLINFIRDSNNIESCDELRNCFLRYLGYFGINQYIIIDLSPNLDSQNGNHLNILSAHSREAADNFARINPVDYTPVYRKARTSMIPFAWEEISDKKSAYRVSRIIDDLQSRSNCSGIGISIHLPQEKIIGIGLASSDKNLECGSDDLILLYAASLHYYMIFSNLCGIDRDKTIGPIITDREREVLLWIARGKSKTETAEILKVSQSTIKRHCENIFKKLEVNNLPSAVAKALHMKIINPF
jgi:DNA-binding CsgD family transcriptional regulator